MSPKPTVGSLESINRFEKLSVGGSGLVTINQLAI